MSGTSRTNLDLIQLEIIVNIASAIGAEIFVGNSRPLDASNVVMI